MDENERYEEICKPNFDKTDKKLDKVLYLLQGNGKPGLISRIERIEQDRQTTRGIVGFIVKNWQLVVVVVILAFNLFSGGQKIDAQQLHDLSRQVRSLESLMQTPPDSIDGHRTR